MLYQLIISPLNYLNDNKIIWSTFNSFNNSFSKHFTLSPLINADGKVYINIIKLNIQDEKQAIGHKQSSPDQ